MRFSLRRDGVCLISPLGWGLTLPWRHAFRHRAWRAMFYILRRTDELKGAR